MLPSRPCGILATFLQCCITASQPISSSSVPFPPPGGRPNIVLFLQDDMDVYMGGLTPMSQARNHLSGHGATASNWFIHTPVCCPSRAQILSGRYFHNVRNDGPGGGCMHVNESEVLPVSVAQYMQTAGYTVGYFGKHMNSCPTKPPVGYDCDTCYWFANGGGRDSEPGGYYNATFNDYSAWPQSLNGPYVGHPGEYAGYTTSIIGNKSIEWVRQVATLDKPFFVTVASKAPHAPWAPAPWYENVDWIDKLQAPRSPDYNVSHEDLKDFHWLIAQQEPISETCAAQVDEIFRKRWKASLSVDDAIAGMVNALEELGLWNRTYFFMTSDHGYDLGNHRLPWGKHNVYDHAIRIPMLMRGPGIKPNSTFDLPASNVDVAPTILGLAGVYKYAQQTMDGRSIAPLVVAPHKHEVPEATLHHLDQQGAHGSTWRDFHLVEYYSLGNVLRLSHLVDDPHSNTYRALRFVDSKRPVPVGGGSVYGSLLYAEFTAVKDWYFENVSHYELFNMTADPHQLNNIYYSWAPETLKSELHELVRHEFDCKGGTCWPIGWGHDLSLPVAELVV